MSATPPVPPSQSPAEPPFAPPEQDSDNEPLPVGEDEVLAALKQGKLRERGLLPYSSNHSFLVLVKDGRLDLPAVYKPQRGESPLWDFEWGTLCRRETAAYLISRALGWNLVPPTVLRNGTRGLGSVQFYVDHDSDAHYFTVQEDARHSLQLRRLALFDCITNNADRKSGHCLVGSDGRIWAIDHGLCFHTEYKLRTVIWEFSGQRIAQVLLDDMDELRMALAGAHSSLGEELCALLNDEERSALLGRLHHLLKVKSFPSPHPHRRNYPWPPV